MKDNNLTITISGESNTGKSRLTFLLAKFLRENNFDITIEQNDFLNIDKFEESMLENFDTVIQSIKEKTNIVFKEVQVQKSNVYNPTEIVKLLENILDSITVDNINVSSSIANIITLSSNFVKNENKSNISTSFILGKYNNIDIIIDAFLKFDDMNIYHNQEVINTLSNVDILDII